MTGFVLSGRRSGSLPFGLTAVQAVTVAAAMTVGAAVVIVVGGPAGVFGALAAGTVAGLIGWFPDRDGRPVHHQAARHTRFAVRRATGRHRHDTGLCWSPQLPALPAPFDTVTVTAVADGPNAVPVAVLTGPRTWSVVVPVCSTGGIVDDATATERVVRWGELLAGLGRDRDLVRVSVSHRRIPAERATHDTWVREVLDPAMLDRYRRVTTDPTAVIHDQHVTLTVRRPDAWRRVVAALSAAAPAAGLTVGEPWSVAQWCDQFARRIDPTRRWRTPATVAERLGVLPLGPVLPNEITSTRTAVRAGGVWHRVFQVVEFPTRAVHARWSDPLYGDGPGLYTWTVIARPVPARRARRLLTADAVALRADLEQRQRHGFRIPGPMLDAEAVLDEHEAELHAGDTEYEWVALLAVCAATKEHLDTVTAAWHDVAARCGIVLGALDAAHDLALGCVLPTGLAPRRRRGR